MRIEESEAELRRRFAAANVALADADAAHCVAIMTAFFADAACEGLSPNDDADMLLFEYSVYDLGHGERFAFDITRQFIRGEGDDEEMFQLHLSCRFRPDAELRALGAFHRWSQRQADVGEMIDLIGADAAYRRVADRAPAEVVIFFERI